MVAELKFNEPTDVQKHEDEKHLSVAHIETNINSAYRIHQENTMQTGENEVTHIETGASPAYGVHHRKWYNKINISAC